MRKGYRLPRLQTGNLDAMDQDDPAVAMQALGERARAAAAVLALASTDVKNRALRHAADLLEKRTDEQELRSNVLKLTEHGQSLLKRIHREWREIDREIDNLIGAENAEHLGSLTYQLRNALGGSTPGGETLDKDASV